MSSRTCSPSAPSKCCKTKEAGTLNITCTRRRHTYMYSLPYPKLKPLTSYTLYTYIFQYFITCPLSKEFGTCIYTVQILLGPFRHSGPLSLILWYFFDVDLKLHPPTKPYIEPRENPYSVSETIKFLYMYVPWLSDRRERRVYPFPRKRCHIPSCREQLLVFLHCLSPVADTP